MQQGRVRSLQLGFRQFRDITPAVAILLARLQALRQGIDRGEATGTVTDVAHQYGFTNPGRLTALYKTAFGGRRPKSCAYTGQTHHDADDCANCPAFTPPV